MKHYMDITLIPDAEANLGFIWQKVYQQIHLMLVENKVSEHDSAIAVSFPHYGDKTFPLGNKLRLFGQTQDALNDLNISRWLARLEDYVHIKTIKPVPESVNQFVCFKRKQFKSLHKLLAGVDDQARKLAAKNDFDVDEVKKRLLASLAKFDTASNLPFINVNSLSTDKPNVIEQPTTFKLFIEKEITDSNASNSELFTCYGLSRREDEKKMAIPWFD